MGKYPITQAQWQAIASTLPVERELDPNLSGFEDDNLPVGAVTWEELKQNDGHYINGLNQLW
jgi:formylglycine-generating enzyme required for sulfatase activity